MRFIVLLLSVCFLAACDNKPTPQPSPSPCVPGSMGCPSK